MTANVRATIVVVDTSRYAKIAPGNLYDTGLETVSTKHARLLQDSEIITIENGGSLGKFERIYRRYARHIT
jgi:hypothetical protein